MIFNDVCKGICSVGRVTPQGISLLGTAFVINKPGYLATAAHVVNHNDKDLVIVLNRHNSIQDYQDTSDKGVTYIQAKIVEINPICDVCLLKIDSDIQSNLMVTSSDSVNVGDNIAIFGYPHCDHGRMVLTQQNTSVGAKIYINSSGIKVKNIVLNIQSRPGQSGSPIINLKDMKIVGMLIGSYAPQNTGGIIIGGIDPQTLHQTTHAVSAEYIKEMI